MQLLFAVLWICHHVVSAQNTQDIITLWQFGQGNLLSAQITLPLTPLGTAADGLSTTYLYQALNNVVIVQTSDGITQVVTSGSPTPRTIVASASGWVENFASQSHMIACSLINSAEGNCIYASFFASSTAISTGPTVAPFPETLTVNTSTPFTTTPPPPSQTIALPSTTQVSTPPVSAPPNTAQPENSSKKSTSVGSIVGGVIGGLAGLSALLVLFLLWRRRRLQEFKAARTISAFDVGVLESAEPTDVLRRPVFREFSDPRYEVEGEDSDTIPNSDSNRFAVGGTDSKAARVARAQIPTSTSVNISTSSQEASSSELEIDPQSLHIAMAEIASRLRRLERNNSRMEPPPVYTENM